jgi:hypothetical protein
VSVSSTSAAAAGPALVATSSYVTTSPGCAVSVSAVFVIETSAARPAGTTSATWLLWESGSFAAWTSATFATDDVDSTVTTRVRVTVAPEGTVPIGQ